MPEGLPPLKPTESHLEAPEEPRSLLVPASELDIAIDSREGQEVLATRAFQKDVRNLDGSLRLKLDARIRALLSAPSRGKVSHSFKAGSLQNLILEASGVRMSYHDMIGKRYVLFWSYLEAPDPHQQDRIILIRLLGAQDPVYEEALGREHK